MVGKQATFHKYTPESTNCSTGTQCHHGKPCGGESQKLHGHPGLQWQPSSALRPGTPLKEQAGEVREQ